MCQVGGLSDLQMHRKIFDDVCKAIV
jgi:hypothetical protein